MGPARQRRDKTDKSEDDTFPGLDASFDDLRVEKSWNIRDGRRLDDEPLVRNRLCSFFFATSMGAKPRPLPLKFPFNKGLVL